MNGSVLLLTDGLAPQVTGGMQQYATSLALALAEAQFEVMVVYTNPEMYSDEKPQEFSDFPQIAVKYFAWPNSGFYFQRLQKYADEIRLHFSKTEYAFDLIFCQSFTALALGPWAGQIPSVVHFHGFEMFDRHQPLSLWIKTAPLRWMCRISLVKCKYVAHFGGNFNLLLNKLRVPVKQRIELYNAIPNKFIASPGSRQKIQPAFIFIGRNERRKNLPLLLAVWKNRVSALGSGATLLVVGDFEPAHIRGVTFVGKRSAPEIRALLDQSTALVLPSLAEGMPTVVLEAMARGCSIIATDVGNVREMVGEAGTIIDVNNRQQLEQAMIDHLNQTDSEQFNQSNLAIQQAKKYSWQTVVDGLKQIIPNK